MKICPFCREEIQDTATKCRYCHEFLNQSQPTEVDLKNTEPMLPPAGQSSIKHSLLSGQTWFVFLLLFIFISLAIFWVFFFGIKSNNNSHPNSLSVSDVPLTEEQPQPIPQSIVTDVTSKSNDQNIQDIRNILRNLYATLLEDKNSEDKISKYSVRGEITESSDYPNSISVFGSAFKLDSNNHVTIKGIDKCAHMQSNFVILQPDGTKALGPTYYNGGVHCCIDKMTEGSNMFGASVPMYWYGPCQEEPQLQDSKSEIIAKLVELEALHANALDEKTLATLNLPRNQITPIIGFFKSLFVDNGTAAVQFVVPEKRNKGSYKPDEITKYYGSLEKPVVVIDIYGPVAPSTYLVAFTSKEFGKAMSVTLAKIILEEVDGQWLIAKIMHEVVSGQDKNSAR